MEAGYTKGYVNALDNAEKYAAVGRLNYSGKELLFSHSGYGTDRCTD